MKIIPQQTKAGTQILGVDLSKPLPAADIEAIRNAFVESGVVVFKEQKFTPEQLLAFSRRFGELENYESTIAEFLMPGYPDIVVISNIVENGKPAGVRGAGQYWHSDRSYVETPAWASVLYGIEIPRDETGTPLGDTLFANMNSAFAALSESQKDEIRGLQAWHQYVYRFTTRAEHERLPPVLHDIVLRHPLSGAECLYVNSGFTRSVEGLGESRSQELLERLFRHATSERFIYRHKWSEGDVVMWDNYSVQHFAENTYGPDQRRLHWRTTIQGFDLRNRDH